MMAFTLTTTGSFSPLVAVVCLVAAAFVFAPQQWRRPKTGVLIALLVVALIGIGVIVSCADFVIRNPCEGLTASDWQYWANSCWAY
jgi:NADH:ubiquinone oxidoreductase subunit 2 (subunit N)